MGQAECLTTDNHRRGRLPSCVTPALSYYGEGSQQPVINPPESGRHTNRRLAPPASDRAAQSRYGNINPFIQSTTPVGLALGPDSPGDEKRGPGTLGHPARGFFTRVSLLMSAFSLPDGPRTGLRRRFAPSGTLSYPAATRRLPRLRWRA